MKIRTKKRLLSLWLTIALISMLALSAYLMSTNDNVLTGFFVASSHHNRKVPILSQKYNIAIEGTLIDKLYDIEATVRPVKDKHLTILQDKSFLTQTYRRDYTLQQTAKSRSKKEKTESHHGFIQSPLLQYEYVPEEKRQFVSSFSPTPIKSTFNKSSNRFEKLVNDFKGKKKSSKNTQKSYLVLHNKNHTWLKTPVNQPNKNIYNLIAAQQARRDTLTDISNLNLTNLNEFEPESINNIVKEFSHDPLKSIVDNVLSPNGIPETPQNIDAIAQAMGLPSGALGSKKALASSLGLTIQELANPDSRLSSHIILSINHNRNYIGKELNLKNTTLADYYDQSIKNFIQLQNDEGEYF